MSECRLAKIGYNYTSSKVIRKIIFIIQPFRKFNVEIKSMKIKATCIFQFFWFLSLISVAQNNPNAIYDEGGEYPSLKNNANHPCITAAQYKIIEEQTNENIRLLRLNAAGHKSAVSTTLSWPLKMANGLNDCSYYYIGNYVDQDTTSPGIKDWNCGTTTYDGHRGNDICTSPYPYYKMDNNEIDVIAAAPGTIVNKVDGHYDKNCVANDSIANYIIIEHADGSVALYWHMKKNSLTSKVVGQTVVAGEFLGVVGSSGDATGPHLHFEVWSGTLSKTLNDAYAGTCNTLNAKSWWITQKPYTEPAIIKTQINSVAPVFTTCPTTEMPNEDTCFAAGASAKFYFFIRNETSGLKANMRIINPGGTTFSSWSHNSVNNYNLAYYVYTKTLPSTAGTYTYEAVYNGITCDKTFTINCGPTGISAITDVKELSVYPNPATSSVMLSSSKDLGLVSLFNSLGELVYREDINSTQHEINIAQKPGGMYFLQVQGKFIKIIKQ